VVRRALVHLLSRPRRVVFLLSPRCCAECRAVPPGGYFTGTAKRRKAERTERSVCRACGRDHRGCGNLGSVLCHWCAVSRMDNPQAGGPAAEITNCP
jgi:hypothetical protein